MISNSSNNYDDRGGNNNNNNNSSVGRTITNNRFQLFRPFTSGHASRRRSNAWAVPFTFYIFCAEVLLLIKHLFVPIALFSQAGSE